MNVLLLRAADENALGRIDYFSLSDQALMEIVFEDTSDKMKKSVQDKNGAFLDVCEWRYIRCDANERVVRFYVAYQSIETLSMSHLPPLVTEVYLLYVQSKKATMTTGELPAHLEILEIMEANFSGPVDMTSLPCRMINFSIQSNQFSGRCDLTSLPPNLKRLDLRGNRFTGSLNLTKLPPRITSLLIGQNNFSGSVCIDFLPPSIEYLWIQANAFSGSFQLKNVPSTLLEVFAQNNRFCGTATVGDIGNVQKFFLYDTEIESVVTPDGVLHPDEKRMINTSPVSKVPWKKQ